VVTLSTIAVTITLPDQTPAGPFTPANPSLGEYSYDYTTTQAGRHVVRAVGTAAAFAHTDVFDVEPAASIALVSLASIKTQLGKTTNTADDELRGYLLSASENIESTCGPCAVRTFTERLYATTGTRRSMWLSNTPVVSLTSMTPVYSWSIAINPATDVTVNLDTGEITRLDAWPFIGDYDVAYKAGRVVIPSSLRTACQIIVQHLWDTRRGGATVSFAGDDTVTLAGWGYAIPSRAAELISGYLEMMFVA